LFSFDSPLQTASFFYGAGRESLNSKAAREIQRSETPTEMRLKIFLEEAVFRSLGVSLPITAVALRIKLTQKLYDINTTGFVLYEMTPTNGMRLVSEDEDIGMLVMKWQAPSYLFRLIFRPKFDSDTSNNEDDEDDEFDEEGDEHMGLANAKSNSEENQSVLIVEEDNNNFIWAFL